MAVHSGASALAHRLSHKTGCYSLGTGLLFYDSLQGHQVGRSLHDIVAIMHRELVLAWRIF